MKQRVFSGMRPTASFIGHLAGALKLGQLQEEHECFYSVVDWHALMSDYADSSRLESNCKEVLIDWLSAGLTRKNALYSSSPRSQHAELHLALSMITPLGWLYRCPSTRADYQHAEQGPQQLRFPGLQSLWPPIFCSTRPVLSPWARTSAHLDNQEIARRFNGFGNVL